MTKKSSKDTSFLYRLTLVAAVVQPLTTIPQVIQLYSSQDASSLSLFTRLGYALAGAYGIQYRLAPIRLT